MVKRYPNLYIRLPFRQAVAKVRNPVHHSFFKVLLDIKDNKALHLMVVLKSLPYVKAKPISDEKALLMEEIKEAVENLKLVHSGKLKARSAKDLLNGL